MTDEPTEDEAVGILLGLQERYERYHRCTYTREAVEAAVMLSSRYIADRYLPDKAIDLLDEAGSRARIALHMRAKGSGQESQDKEEAQALLEQLQQVMKAKDQCVKGETYEEAVLLRQREVELKALLSSPGEEDDVDGSEPGVIARVTRRDIESIVTQWTGVPVEKMSGQQMERMLHLADTLKGKVVGQDEATEAISRAMQRCSVGLKAEGRPIAAMLFAGPTGVGKTELARAMALEIFGSREAMVRLDMSEFMERHSVSKLVGSPPGYVGFGEGGTLTEAVRRRPFSLVLLDEIEKAHPDVLNLMLQTFEDGRLTDSQGRTVSFKNTVIVMTSNLGSNVILKGGQGMGFQVPTEASAEDVSYSRIRGLVMEEMRSFFRPELLNRLDEIVVFRQLGVKEVRSIADHILEETAERMAAKGISMELTKAMMDKIIREGYDQQFGARPLRRAIMNLVDDKLADEVLLGNIEEGALVRLDCDDDDNTVAIVSDGSDPAVADVDPADIAYSHILDLSEESSGSRVTQKETEKA